MPRLSCYAVVNNGRGDKVEVESVQFLQISIFNNSRMQIFFSPQKRV